MNRKARKSDLQKTRKKDKLLIIGISKIRSYWQTIKDKKTGKVKKIEHFHTIHK